MKLFYYLLFIYFIFISGCASKEVTLPPDAASIIKKLQNASYVLSRETISPKAQFKDGYYEEDFFDTENKVTVKLDTHNFVGDLNLDGINDAVTILKGTNGGDGEYLFLAALLNNGEELKSLEARLIGDRVKIESLEIKSGYIILEYLTHKFHEDKSIEPTDKILKVYEVKDDYLVEITKKEPHEVRFKDMDLSKFNVLWKKARKKNHSWVRHPLQVVRKYIGDFEGYEQRISIKYDYPVDPTKAIIKIEEQGYPDDSVSGGYYIFNLERVNYKYWALKDARESWTCIKGRGHSDYSYDLCK